MDLDTAAEAKVTGFLETLRRAGLRFDYEFLRPGMTLAAGDEAEEAGGGAQRSTAAPPQLLVQLSGPDTSLLIDRGGDLLHAMESMAASILRLAPEEQDRLSFDADGFKQARLEAVRRAGTEAIATVRGTGRPFVFAPMNSRERRMLHLLLADQGFPTASSGDGPRRFVVLYPQGATPTPEQFNPPPPPRRNDRGGPGPRRAPDRPRNGARGFSSSGRSASEEPAAPAPRLDPNGNPLEQPGSVETPEKLSEDERLASLRRAFRKR